MIFLCILAGLAAISAMILGLGVLIRFSLWLAYDRHGYYRILESRWYDGPLYFTVAFTSAIAWVFFVGYTLANVLIVLGVK